MDITGDSAKERLSWILRYTSDPNRAFLVQNAPINDKGVHANFKDGSDRQLGQHFLTGVRFGFDRSTVYSLTLLNIAAIYNNTRGSSDPCSLSALEWRFDDLDTIVIRIMIGHEVADPFWGFHDIPNTAYAAATNTDVANFRAALNVDYRDDTTSANERTTLLRRIFEDHDVASSTAGQSIEDMALFLKGYRFGSAVRTGVDGPTGNSLITRIGAARWLRRHLSTEGNG